LCLENYGRGLYGNIFSTFDPLMSEILVIIIDIPRACQVVVMHVYVAEGHSYQRAFALVGSVCNLILIILLFWTLCHAALHTGCLKGNVWCTVIQTLYIYIETFTKVETHYNI
jgi:hypothetical protein